MVLGGRQPKVFCSYRSTDRVVVEAFAQRLLASGLDAWFDHWEIRPGDDIVAKMDEGLDGCDAGLIFLSEAWFDGRWAYDEYTSLAFRKVEDEIRLIPVMVEDVAARLPTGCASWLAARWRTSTRSAMRCWALTASLVSPPRFAWCRVR